MNLEIGKSYIMVTIDSFMAMTHKTAIVITRKIGERFIYKQKGKRKEFYVPDPAKDSVLFFDLSDQNAIKVDTDGGGVMRGNACFNFTFPEPDALRKLIDEKCINITDKFRAECLYVVQAHDIHNEENEVLLYPDIEIHHAVVNRIKERMAS